MKINVILYVKTLTLLHNTALQARSSRVQFPMVSLEVFIGTILPAAPWPWGWLIL